MTEFLLIRHALTDATGKYLSGRMQGLSLNETGRKQSEKLAEKLAGEPIAAICCSPLERAVQTAAPLSEQIHLPLIFSDDFLEIDFGKWTNASVDSLLEDPHFVRFNSFRSNTRPPGGELMAEVQLRFVRGLEKLGDVYRDQTVAVFSHADPIRAAIAWYAGISLDLISRIEISPASVSIVRVYADTAQILLINGIL